MTKTFISEKNSTGKRFDISASLKETFSSFHSAISILRDFRIAIPSIIFLTIHLGILILYLSSLEPPLTSFWALFIRGLSGSDIGHFPGHIILMQPILDRLDILIDIFINIIFQGVTVILVFSFAFDRSLSLRDGFRGTLGKYLQLLLVSVVASTLIYAVFLLVGNIRAGAGVLEGYIIYSAGIVIALAIQGLFLYTTPAILLYDADFFRSVRKSFSIAADSAATTFFVVLFPFILTLPTTFIGIKAGLIATRLSPDFIIYNYVVSSIIEMISTYLIIAGGTIIFMGRMKNSLG
ncbi:MAG: hypothetical protein JW814_01395 [Candidatus Krumholzibacteriota bacterium]|nr:hypothetical protein [Candidatus Krumholzibacteriota bacterium]